MKQALISAVVAAVVSVVAIGVVNVRDDAGAAEVDQLAAQLASHALMAERLTPQKLSYTAELVEDGWVNAARTAGADHKPLADAANSICYLTKIEIKGMRGPEDSTSCSIAVDDFTGFWEVTAAVDEGGQSEVRCNARCLVWEPDDSANQ
jgi:hypothetical protein